MVSGGSFVRNFSSPTEEITGFDGFNGNVVLQNLLLPSDNPAGGINFEATTVLTNPR